jgi:hypothetical protein
VIPLDDNATARAFRALWRRSDPANRIEPFDPAWDVRASLPATRTDERELRSAIPWVHAYHPLCSCLICKWG